ncbi:MAG: hypothetical protein LBG11_00250, partial [Bifidobacteriaceae bacterium]|nr:hypothetical protein [Bifidobacteriaceae bacterium]
MLVAVAVVVALAVAGGGAYALLALKGGSAGASSPEDAAKALFNDTETLLTDMAALDIAKVASHFAPSEQGLFEGVADASKSVTTDNAQSDELKESLESAQKALTIDFKDLEFTGETLAEGVNRTAVTGGTISLDADVPALATAILDIYDSRPSISQMGLDPIDQSHLEEQLGAVFPVSKGADDLAALAGLNDLFVVTVQEEGDWFVSLSMTAAQYSFEDSGLDRVDLGDPIPESEMKGASDANGALDNFISALDAAATSGDLRELAKALPVAESRLVAVYGPALTSADEGGAAGLSEVLGGVTGTKTGEIGGHARITLDSLVIPGYFTLTRQDDTWTLSIEDGGEQIEVTLTQESRQKWTFDLAQNSEYGVTTGSASISIPSKGVIEGEVVSEGTAVSFKYEGGCVSVDMMGESQEMCGDELGVDLTDSGLDEFEKLPDLKNLLALSAIKGAGGDWYISIGASLIDW